MRANIEKEINDAKAALTAASGTDAVVDLESRVPRYQSYLEGFTPTPPVGRILGREVGVEAGPLAPLGASVNWDRHVFCHPAY